jgi:4-hydroxy-tetrahydrodipicolinate synthase
MQQVHETKGAQNRTGYKRTLLKGADLKRQLTLAGILPAIVLPLNPDYSIDEEGLKQHIRRVVGVPGVTGIVCNAHASEVTSLSPEERKRVLQIVCQEVNGEIPVISGAYGESTEKVKTSARDAKRGGADAILIMPPFSFSWGATQYPDVVFDYFSTIDQEVDIPFIIFQYAHWTNCNYNCQTLSKLAKIKNFIAIKNAINDPYRYEEEYRCLKSLRPEISFLNANDVQLLSYFCIGSDGALVGYACLAPEFIVDMYDATKGGDLEKAREISNHIYPLTRAIYSHPRLNWHTRIKEALVLMGEIRSAAVRPFLPTISHQEREDIRGALLACRLIK